MLMCRRRSSRNCASDMLAISTPSNMTWPDVGAVSRLSSRTRVDFPEPDSPITTKISPS